MKNLKKIIILCMMAFTTLVLTFPVNARTIKLVNTKAQSLPNVGDKGDYCYVSTTKNTTPNSKLGTVPTKITYTSNNAYYFSPDGAIKSINGFSVTANVGKVGTGTVDLWNGNTFMERINIVVRPPISSIANGKVKGNNVYYEETQKADEMWLYTNQSHRFDEDNQTSGVWVSQWFSNMSYVDSYAWDDNGANNFSFSTPKSSVTNITTGSKSGDFKLCCHAYQNNDGNKWKTIHCQEWWKIHLTAQPYLSATSTSGNELNTLRISTKTKNAKIKIKNNNIVSDDIEKEIYVSPSSEDFIEVTEEDGVYNVRAKAGFDLKKTAYICMRLKINSGDAPSDHNGPQVIIKELPVKLYSENSDNSGKVGEGNQFGIITPGLSSKATIKGAKITISTPYKAAYKEIYRKKSNKGKYKKIATLNPGVYTFVDKKAPVGKKCIYRCRIRLNGNYSLYSPIIKSKAKFRKPQIKALGKVNGLYKIKIKGKKYTGFAVYIGTSKKKVSKKIKLGKHKTITINRKIKGKYLKVKSYKKYGKKKYYSKSSQIVKISF